MRRGGGANQGRFPAVLQGRAAAAQAFGREVAQRLLLAHPLHRGGLLTHIVERELAPQHSPLHCQVKPTSLPVRAARETEEGTNSQKMLSDGEER